MSNIERIIKIPSIIDAWEIEFDSKKRELLGILDKKQLSQAKTNSKLIRVYRIIYRSQRHRVVGFMIEPKKGKNLPCIVYNRGGSNDFGSIKLGNLFIDLADFALNGYLVIASQYSGSTGSEGVDQFGGDDIYDILNLYKIIKGYSRIDKDCVGMWGWSRGGMMTYLCLSKVKWIKAAVVGAAPADEVNAPMFRKNWRAHQIKMYGGSKKEQIKRSAIYWTNKIYKNTPLLIMHGTSDWRVNPLDSIHLAEKLYQHKIPHRLIMFEGADHGINEFKEEVNDLTFRWFDTYVKNRGKLPNLKMHGR